MKNTSAINNQIYDVIIIGGGASGLFAAAAADLHAKGTASQCKGSAFKGLILEKTARPGTKLLMSGSGQCNITHAGSIKDFIGCYGDKGKKLRSCLYKHSNLALMEFLEDNGVEVFTREDGKVFPKSMDAHDVLYMLIRRAKKNGFELKCGSEVTRLLQATDSWTVTANDTLYHARNVIIATGGCSYPTTGSDGSFFNVLRNDLSIEITELKPSLTPIQVNEYPYAELSGISFENINTSIWHKDKKIAETCEDLLFTHKDLSGPAVINISKYAQPGGKLKINYLHPLNYEQVLSMLKSAFHGAKGSTANIIASEFDLPKRFCQLFTARHGEALKTLAHSLTGEEFIINSVSGFNKAMATAGGIALDQINTSTFELKNHPGLYAIGEALDVDGITGGYNLQFAYSSAKSAMVTVQKEDML
ncbi:MAG: aminoacetone oxidase family FAD-binding enzyme [Bacillota bacterium]|nr:aminoacetone oxidase family FAD-binding enzyme [Bacillota bacterium]